MDNTGTLRWCQDVFPTGPLPTCCQYADHAEANLAYGPFAVRLMCSFAAIFLYVWNFKSYFTNFAPLRFLRQIFLYHFSVGETPCRSKRKSSSSSLSFIFNFVTYLMFAIYGCLCKMMLTFGKLTKISIIWKPDSRRLL